MIQAPVKQVISITVEGDQVLTLTDNEIRLIAAIRSLHPHEKVTVTADQNGRPDYFIVERSYKEIWPSGK